jgi:ABC-type dipeptide/oligopeptide/nickel transport system ATPase component
MAQGLELLDEIQTRLGIALLFITHDLRVANLRRRRGHAAGPHRRTGPAARVPTNPQVAYTQALLDAAPGREWDFANFRPVAVRSGSFTLTSGKKSWTCRHSGARGTSELRCAIAHRRISRFRLCA